MKNHTIYIIGISTEVGKTITSAIVAEALSADYWKPIQSGDLQNTDTMKVQGLISNSKTQFFPSAYAFKFPASPHLSAQMEDVEINLSQIKRPKTSNTLVIEGAGGLFVPLNNQYTMADLIQPTDKIIIVSRHYLGSINHTILTFEALRSRKLDICGIIFSGNKNISTENWILQYTKIPFLGRINEEKNFDKGIIKRYSEEFSVALKENLDKKAV